MYNYKRNILFYTYFNVYPKYHRESQARASPSEKRKFVKSKKLCGGATFVGLHEVGAYGNRHSLMPDLNGAEWTGCPKWLDEQC